MRQISILIIIFFVLSCSPQEQKSQLEDRIRKIENGLRLNLEIEGEDSPTYNIEDRLRELGIPGLSIAVVNEGKIEWAKGYGIADSLENRSVDKTTMFLAGSISKPVAAIRVHQLVEQGSVDLDANINDYLTTWKIPENEFTSSQKVTLRRILNHTAGLTIWGFPGYDKGDTIPTLVDVLDGKGNTDSVRVYKEPGESWMYSGGGYTIMQLMIENLEKAPFPAIMQQNVLNPLGMTASTFSNPLPEEHHGIAATGYRSDGEEVEGKWPIYPEMAAAGLWTTPSQLILYAIEMGRILQTGKDGLLKSSTLKEMLTPGMNGHGLGPTVQEFTFGHGGADEGFRAQLMAWKETANAVVIMVNSDNGSIIQEILRSVADAYNLPGYEPVVKTIINLSEDDRTKYTGIFYMEEYGEIKIKLKDKGLEASGSWFNVPAYLLPENDSIFFNRTSGTQYIFDGVDGIVTGFKVRDLKAKKID